MAFKAPDNEIVKSPLTVRPEIEDDPGQEAVRQQLLKQEAVFPLPPEQDPSTMEFERGPYYPGAGVTGLAPAVDLAIVGQLGAAPVKALASKLGSRQALKKAITGMEDISKLAPQKELGLDIGEGTATRLVPTGSLKEAKGIPTTPFKAPEADIIYHGTRKEAAEKIMKEGFASEKRMGAGADALTDIKGFTGKGTSVTPSKELAESYGRMVDPKTSRVVEGYIPKDKIFDVSKQDKLEEVLGKLAKSKKIKKADRETWVKAESENIRFTQESNKTAEAINKLAAKEGKEAVRYPDKEILAPKGSSIRRTKMEEPTPVQTELFPTPAKQLSKSEQQAITRAEMDVMKEPIVPPTPPTPTSTPPREGFQLKLPMQGQGTPTTPLESQPELFKRVSRGKSTKPIEMPKKEEPLLPGAKERIAAFAEKPGKDIDPKNPLTSRVEMNEKLGALKETAVKQTRAGLAQDNQAVLETNRIVNEFKSKTTVRPDSLESRILFDYIENKNKIEADAFLAQTLGAKKAGDIRAAADYMKETTDDLIARMNIVRRANGQTPLQYRDNYVPHAAEMDVLTSLKKLELLGTPEGAKLADEVLGAGNELAKRNPNLYSKLEDVIFRHVHRRNDESAKDAVAQWERYVAQAENYIKMQPYVNELHASAKAVKDTMPNLSSYLSSQADYIAGGRSPIDKGLEAVIPASLMQAAKQLQSNAKGNIILGSPGVLMSQTYGLLSSIGKYPAEVFGKVVAESFFNPKMQQFALSKSEVLQNRAVQAASQSLDSGPVKERLAGLVSWFDYKAAEISWMTAFKNAVREGVPVEKAVMDADQWAGITQSVLSKVSTPEFMRSSAVQTVLPLMNQQVAAARSLWLQTFQGKPLTGKAIAAAKVASAAYILAAMKGAVTGREDHPLNPFNVIPFGGVLEFGMGGPVFNAAARIMKSKSEEDFIKNVIQAGMLVQRKIPAGVAVSRVIGKALTEE